LSPDRKFLSIACNISRHINHNNPISTPTMVNDTVTYLREIAQTCTRLARACPHRPTSHGLEEIAVDLMAKAQELERHYSGE